MTEQSMIERVARAMVRYDWSDPIHPFRLSPEELDERVEEGWRSNIGVATAALEAAREPTSAMLEAFSGAALEWVESEGMPAEVGDASVWQAMIDAALSEKPQ